MYGRFAVEKTRVLVVTEDETLATALSDMLESQGQAARIYWVAAPELASTRARDVLPDITFVDDVLGGADPVFVVRELRAAAPETSIVMVVEPTALRVAQNALLAGAGSFLTKPVESHDLLECMRAVRAASPTLRSGADSTPGGANHIVVVVAAARGGMGRTVLAGNLAITLRELTNKSVVLVDANLDEPGVDVALNLHADFDISHLVQRLSHIDHDLLQSVLISHSSGIKVLQAPPWAFLRETFAPPQIEEILGQLKRSFTWVVVDLGLVTSDETLTYLDAADCILTVLQPELTSVRSTHSLISALLNEGYTPDKIRLVLNREDMPGGLAPQVIAEYLPLPISFGIPDDQPLVSQSINRGVPLVLSHERSAVAKAIRRMAGELFAGFGPRRVVEPKTTSNVMGRLFRQSQLRSALARSTYVNPRHR